MLVVHVKSRSGNIERITCSTGSTSAALEYCGHDAPSSFQCADMTTVDGCINDHIFNHGVEMILPWPSSANADPLEGCAKALGCEAFWRVSGPLSALLQPEFVDAHIRCGALCALTATALDGGGSLAITPRGDLLIVCDRTLYQTLGLHGLASCSGPNRFCVRVPLLDSCFSPGRDAHTRLMKAARIIGDIVLLLTWQVDGVSTTPNFPAPISAMRCDLEASSRTYHRIRVPQVCELFNAANAVDAHEIHGDGRWPGSCASAHGKFDDLGMAEEEAADFVEIVADSSDGTGRPAGAAAPRDAVLLELHEWIGLIALDARVVLEALPFSPFVVNGNLPDNLLFEQPKGEVEVRSYMGMVSVDVVRRLLEEGEILIHDHGLPWIALTVWGFSDAPVTWGLLEQELDHTCPHNDYTVLLLPQRNRVVFYTFSARGGCNSPCVARPVSH